MLGSVNCQWGKLCLGIHFDILVSSQPIFVWQPSCFDSGSVLINWWPIHVWWAVWYGVRVHWIAKGTGWRWCCGWHCYMAVGSCLSFSNKQCVVRLALFVWLGWAVDLLEELVLVTSWHHLLFHLIASFGYQIFLLMQHLISLSPPIHHPWAPHISLTQFWVSGDLRGFEVRWRLWQTLMHGWVYSCSGKD